MAVWEFILTELDGTTVGALTNAKERQVSTPLSRMPTAKFKLRLDHPLAADLTDGSAKLLKCYRINNAGVKSIKFAGPVIASEEAGTDLQQTISCSASSPLWYATHRIIGAVSQAGTGKGPGRTYDNGAGGPLSTASIVGDILDDANSVEAPIGGDAYTGVELHGSSSTSTTAIFGRHDVRIAAEIISELAVGAPFEWIMIPIEPVDIGRAVAHCANMLVLDLVGGNAPDCIFEYGTPRANIVDYRRVVSMEGMCNRATISVSGWPSAPGTHDLIKIADATSIASYGLIEDIIADSGIIDDTLRTDLATEHVTVRKVPRQTLTFTTARNATPEPFVDYDVGDTVRARVVVAGSSRFDGSVRVHGITVDLDDEGNEQASLELSAE